MATPTPGLTPSPPSGAAQSGDAIAQMLNAAGSQTVPGGKPSMAFTGNYGPLASTQRFKFLSDLPGAAGGGAPITKTVSEMANEFYNWDQKKKDQFRAKLGLINKNALVASDADLADTWANYVQQSANYYSAGATLTPDDILNKDVATHGAGASLAGTRTSKTTDIQLTSQADSNAIFNSAAKALLGRAPTQAEYARFQSTLNAQERANPVNATTTSTTDAEGNVVSQSRTSSGGIGAGGAQLLAQQAAQQNPEYGAYQAATTYWNAAMQAIQRGY